MRINFILSALANSGGSKVVDKYAELLSELGHDVVIYRPYLAFNTHRYHSFFINSIHQGYCTCKSIFRKKNRKNRVFDRWIPYITSCYIRKADVIIATAWPTAYAVSKLDNKCGKKWYFIQDYEIWDNKELGEKSYLLELNKIVISTWINNQLKRDLKIGPFPIVPNGLNSDIFNCNDRTEHEGIRFLMLNHTLRKKGVDFGLKVFEEIHRKYPNTQLQMFGLCSNENIPSGVEYHQNPSVTELVNLYRNSDIFIFPSREEGWGLTPVEAMACGCVVVGTNTGFVLDIGVHMKNMMISDPDDMQGMVNNIIRIIENKELFMKIKEEGSFAAASLDWRSSVCKLEALIKG